VLYDSGFPGTRRSGYNYHFMFGIFQNEEFDWCLVFSALNLDLFILFELSITYWRWGCIKGQPKL
jgi:hypothetical protein